MKVTTQRRGFKIREAQKLATAAAARPEEGTPGAVIQVAATLAEDIPAEATPAEGTQAVAAGPTEAKVAGGTRKLTRGWSS